MRFEVYDVVRTSEGEGVVVSVHNWGDLRGVVVLFSHPFSGRMFFSDLSKVELLYRLPEREFV